MARPKTSSKPIIHPLRPPMPLHMRTKYAPSGLSALKVEAEQKEMLQRQALDIFTIMTNAGHSFADSLAAILLSGLEWGTSISKDPVRIPDRIIV